MSDDLLDRLARENPLPEQLPALPIEPLLRRLDAEAGATSTPSRDAHTRLQPAAKGLRVARVPSRRDVSRPARRAATAIPMLFSILIVAGITVLAITTLSHRHGTTAPSPAPESSRTELLQTLGILRRPQTRSDLVSMLRRGAGGAARAEFLPLSPSARHALCPRLRPLAPRCSLELDKSLIRAVNVGGGYQVAIFPAVDVRRTSSNRQPAGEGVVITLRGPGIYLAVSGPEPMSVQAIRSRGLLLSDHVDDTINRGVILVPDGVAKVTLDHFALTAPTASSLDQIAPTTSTVTNNLAVFQLAGITEHNLHLNPRGLRTYLRQASGHGCQITIHRTTIAVTLYVSTHHPVPDTTTGFGRCSS
jgi:hypothetical protein